MWGSTPKPSSTGMLSSCLGTTPQSIAARASSVLKATKPALLSCLAQAQRWARLNATLAIVGAVAVTSLAWCNIFKSLPLVWHARVFFNTVFPRKGYFEADKPGSVFRPLITPSSVSYFEADHSLEKSTNSYYADLDLALSDILGSIRHEAIRGGLLEEGYEDGIQIYSAGTSCTFKESLRPGMSFDMQSRVLAWDAEFIYVVTHFVEKQRNKAARSPATPTLKAGHKKKGSGSSGSSSTGSGSNSRRASCLAFATLPQVVYATAISKCRIKSGRLLVSPSEFLDSAGLAVSPLDHSDMGSMVSGVSPSSLVSSSSSASQMTSSTKHKSHRKHNETEKERKERKEREKKEKKEREREREKKEKKERKEREKANGNGKHADNAPVSPNAQRQPAGEAMMAWLAGIDGWTWDFVEEERIRGLKIADRVFGFGLDAAHEEFINPK